MPPRTSKVTYACTACGTVTNRWQGQCDSCGEWNTLQQDTAMQITQNAPPGAARKAKRGQAFALEGLKGEHHEVPRIASDIVELDRVTGGGFVAGSVLLLSGEPGIGKSTLLIQTCAALARKGHRVVYISGEEAIGQVRLRAGRLGLADAPVELASETSVEDILATLSHGKKPSLVIIDSIQTMWTDTVESAPGTVTQVRACAQFLIRYAKTQGVTLIVVGHVTKDGQVAGPRVVEHMVDAVISFEGDTAHHFRMLRASKNRFGPTDEIGVFEMTNLGLQQVLNPSALFLSTRDMSAAGVAIFAGMEGTRPLLVEIQALVAPTSLGTPRRAVVGWDPARLAMVLAVLDAHAGVRLGQHDVYLSVAGGLRITEPAADLAVAAALVSSLTGKKLCAETVYFGELGLSGSVRPVAHANLRIREAKKLGFNQAHAPANAQNLPDKSTKGTDKAEVALAPCAHVRALVADIAAKAH